MTHLVLSGLIIAALRLEDFTDTSGRKDRRVVADSGAAPLWARFHEFGTNQPIFLGRDSVVRYAYSEIEHERRNGYAYYGRLLDADLPRWRETHKR